MEARSGAFRAAEARVHGVMSIPRDDAAGRTADPVADERGKQGTNYPHGVGDEFEYCLLDDSGNPGAWQSIRLEGSWFPEAFIGSMAQVQCHKEGTLERMTTDVSDVIHTMGCVEAAYESNRCGGVRPDDFLTPP